MSHTLCLRCLVMLLLVLPGGREMRAQGRAEIALAVQTATGTSTFRMGERIPLVLVYAAGATTGLGIMPAANVQRRFLYEGFEVEPKAGWADPLAEYLQGLTCCGGPTSSFEPFTKPVTVNLDLNASVRFDQPGVYRVTVLGRRVLDPSLPGPEQPVVRSNVLTLRIVPAEKEWQAGAVAALRVPPGQYAMPGPEQAAALATVQYLGSRESFAVMAAGLGEATPQRNEAFAYGLIGASPTMHQAALRAVQQQVEDPKTAVSEWMMQVLAALLQRPGSGGDTDIVAAGAARGEALELLLAALPRKAHKARALTAVEALNSLPSEAGKEQRAGVARLLAASFGDLPEDKQSAMLTAQWDHLQEGIPTEMLRQRALLPVSDPADRFRSDSARSELKAVALRRWFARDPEAAKQAAYAEISTGNRC